MSDDASQYVQKALNRLGELSSQAQCLVGDLGNFAGIADCDSEHDTFQTRLGEFIKCDGPPYDLKQPYHREPFAADVSKGKNHFSDESAVTRTGASEVR